LKLALWPSVPAEEAVVRRRATSAMRQRTIEANGIDCGASCSRGDRRLVEGAGRAYDGATAFLAASLAFPARDRRRGVHGGSSAARKRPRRATASRAALRGRARERLGSGRGRSPPARSSSPALRSADTSVTQLSDRRSDLVLSRRVWQWRVRARTNHAERIPGPLQWSRDMTGRVGQSRGRIAGRAVDGASHGLERCGSDVEDVERMRLPGSRP
jgi:hypothetical protein